MSTSPRAVADAIAASATKREVASVLGISASRVACLVCGCDDRALKLAWRRLPADGAFSGVATTLPRAHPRQDRADRLVAEAAADSPIDLDGNQREETVLLLLALANIVGGLELPRGWVRAVIRAFEAAGHPSPPTAASVRWYRTRLANEPEMFRDVRDADQEVLADLIERAAR